MEYRVFARGALPEWTIHFRWTNKNNTGPALGYFDQQTTYPYWYGECQPGATCTMGVTGTVAGSGIVYAYAEDGDWRTDDVLCSTTRPLTVLTCTPSCVANCGQPNGCGANCASTDSGAPGTPTNLSPANGTNVAPATSQVTISWTSASALTDTYDLQVAPASNLDCNAAGGDCADDITSTSYNFAITNGIYSYAYRVRATNITCGGQDSAWSAWTYFGIADDITGTFYDDPLDTATVVGGVCVLGAGSTPITLGAGAILTGVGVDGVTRTATIGTNNFALYTYFWNPGNNTLTLDPGIAPNGQPYMCTCPSGCTYSGINSPQTNTNFFIAENNLINQGWFQARGSNAYAAESSGVAIRSYVPDYYCTAGNNCIPYVLTTDLAGSADSAGLALTGGGAVDTTNQPGNSAVNTTERATQVTAIGTQNTRLRENYDFYYREFSLGLSPSDDFSSSANDARKPTSAPGNGKQAYFRNGDLTIQSAWNVTAGENITVLVDGNLTISDPTSLGQVIRVQEGGFLAFIVSGNIIINTNVGNSVLTDTTTNIEGVFIADGQLLTPSVGTAGGGDERFIGAGTFVGWSGITLSRDFDDGASRKAENNTKPAETFIFRPDFVENVPEQMTRSNYIWQETN